MTPIEEKIAQLAKRRVDLGVALSFEVPLFDGGVLQDFDLGTIYFHPTVGAFLCQGEILKKYRELGEVQSGLGYPVSDEGDDPFVLLGRMNEFEFGTIAFSDEVGIRVQFNEVTTVPQVVVKIDDSIPVSLSSNELFSLDDLVSDTGSRGGEFIIEAIRSIFPDLRFRRTFDSLTSQEILDLVAQAQDQDPEYSPPNFDNFLEIDCPVDFDTDSLANTLKAWTGVVEYAYTALAASDPAVVGTANPRFHEQGYLHSAPKGISVQDAWAKGADGADTRLIDIEQGWYLDHEDLPTGIPLLGGDIRWESRAHGMAVLGEIVALDNSTGVVGISPLTTVSLLSRFSPDTADQRESRDRIAAMVMLANSMLLPGDVILIEAQITASMFGLTIHPGTQIPVETDPRIFAAIELATKRGVIVVEPAGNGSANLDEFENHEGKKVLLRGSSEFKNSGAILVAAATSALPHQREAASNFGSRADCYAWGENITTIGSRTNPAQRDAYMNDMSGTSGAAAIIAGVCLLVQNLQFKLTPVSGIIGSLHPAAMLRMLSKPQNGTVSSDKIGVMPDFKKIIANEYR